VTADLLARLGMKVIMLPWIGAPSLAPGAEIAAWSGRLAEFFTRTFMASTVSTRPARSFAPRRQGILRMPNIPEVETEVEAWYDAKSSTRKNRCPQLNRVALDNAITLRGVFLHIKLGAKASPASSKGPLPFFWGVAKSA